MPRHRVVLLGLSVLALLPAIYLATKDVRFRDRACGTALISSDPNKGAVVTGDRVQDDFQQEVYASECGHRLLGMRILVAIPTAIALALWIASSRWKPREQIPGDSLL